MLELPHTAVGVLIALKIPNPIISLPLALVSHLILDEIPHWNPNISRETEAYGRPSNKTTMIVLVDVLLSLALGFFVAFKVLPDTTHALTILSAAFMSVSLDVVEGFHFFLGVRESWLKKLIEYQRKHQSRSSKIPGLLTQVVVLLIALYLTLSK